MSLLKSKLLGSSRPSVVSDFYEVTRKPQHLRSLEQETVPFVPMEAIPAGGQFQPRYSPRNRAEISSATYFEKGDILLAKITPSFENGKQAIANNLPGQFGYATTEVIPLRPHGTKQDRRFLFFYLLHPEVRSYLAAKMEGSTGRQRVPEEVILNLPFPALSESSQIAIAEVLCLVRRAIEIEQSSVAQCALLKTAAMYHIFEDGLTSKGRQATDFGSIPAHWEVDLLEQCGEVQTGVAKGRKISNGELAEVPYLRVANVQDGRLDLEEVKNIQIRRSEVERYRLRTGDVLLTEGGDFDKLGRGFIWRGELDLCVHQNHIFAVRPHKARLLPEFFAYVAQSPYGKAYFLKVAHKTTNLACINTAKLKAFPVPIPPRDEQAKIVKIFDALDRKTDLHKRKTLVLERLFQSLLHKLLTGEIPTHNLDLSALANQSQGQNE
jgi:type I restriction enzyme, S subunit